MPSFGEELRRAREERGISLRQISDATHIGVRFLQAIESDNYAILPGGIFNRAFVKNYARYIGLDEEQALARYNQQLEEQGGEPPRVPAARFEGIEEDEPSSWGSISLIILILLILGLGGYGLWRYLKGNAAKANESVNPSTVQSQVPASVPSPAATETPQPSVSPVAASPSPEASASPTTAPVSNPAATGLQIKIQTTGNKECWVRFIPDAEKFKDRTLGAGGSLDIAANDKVVLSVGDVTAVEVTINGRPAKFEVKGKGTSVTNVLITKENYQQFLK